MNNFLMKIETSCKPIISIWLRVVLGKKENKIVYFVMNRRHKFFNLMETTLCLT